MEAGGRAIARAAACLVAARPLAAAGGPAARGAARPALGLPTARRENRAEAGKGRQSGAQRPELGAAVAPRGPERMRLQRGLECSVAAAVFAVLTWLDASLGVGRYGSVSATATYAGPGEGRARADPGEDNAGLEEEHAPRPSEGGQPGCSTESGAMPLALEEPRAQHRPPEQAATPALQGPSATDPPTAKADPGGRPWAPVEYKYYYYYGTYYYGDVSQAEAPAPTPPARAATSNTTAKGARGDQAEEEEIFGGAGSQRRRKREASASKRGKAQGAKALEASPPPPPPEEPSSSGDSTGGKQARRGAEPAA